MGYLDWWKRPKISERKGKRSFKPKSQAYAVQESGFDTPFDVDPVDSRTDNEQKDLMTTMYNDMFKMFSEKWNSHDSGSESVTESVNFAGTSLPSHALTFLQSDASLLSE